MTDYTLCYKTNLPVADAWPAENRWDLFVSAYTQAERVTHVFQKVAATRKRWLLLPEYDYRREEYPPEQHFSSAVRDEAELAKQFWNDDVRDLRTLRLCIDITGFIRPHLIYLLKYLFDQGVQRFDAIYSEPGHYVTREHTQFSSGRVHVRQVAGYEGLHSPNISEDVLIVGAGYEHELLAIVAEHKDYARKILLYGFPSLRADMYQENVLNAKLAEEAIGGADNFEGEPHAQFAPANDPFVTASVLREIVAQLTRRTSITNLYLCPLATKPQVLGFALYFLTERRGGPTSIVFPYAESYSKNTSAGIYRIWKYTVELPRLNTTTP